MPEGAKALEVGAKRSTATPSTSAKRAFAAAVDNDRTRR